MSSHLFKQARETRWQRHTVELAETVEDSDVRHALVVGITSGAATGALIGVVMATPLMAPAIPLIASVLFGASAGAGYGALGAGLYGLSIHR